MDREILFRAKRLDNRKWVNGYYVKYGNDCFIIPFFGISTIEKQEDKTCDTLISLKAHRVDPETICQYTGLTDKNGNKIWENDIVRDCEITGCAIYNAIIVWDDQLGAGWHSKVCCIIHKLFSNMKDWSTNLHENEAKKMEVIGNIFDNPELISK